MKTKVIVVVQQGCVVEVFSMPTQVEIEVIDLDGDYADEGERKIKRMENNPAFSQVWP